MRENNKVAVAGTAAPNATVSVAAASSTSRKDRAFGAEVAPANATGPVLAQASVSAALAGAGPGGADLVRTDLRTFLAPARTQAFVYDLDGNLRTDGLWLYTYDAENRLVRMSSTLPAGFGASLGHVRLRLDFKYDYLGRRIEKRVTNLDTSTETLARRFIYDEGWNLVAEFDSLSTLTLTRSYTWGLDKWGGLTDSGGPGGLLQITAYANGAPTGNYYPGYDHQGNVVTLTRAADGFLAAVYEYDPFGNPVRNEPFDPAVADQPFRYATKWRDEETGLVYYGHRYYAPTLGRFINQDPIGEAGGLNLYGFVGNNVVNLSDYLGWETNDHINAFNEAYYHNLGDADFLPPDTGDFGSFGGASDSSPSPLLDPLSPAHREAPGTGGPDILTELILIQSDLIAQTLADQAAAGEQPPPEVQTAPPTIVVADPGVTPGPVTKVTILPNFGLGNVTGGADSPVQDYTPPPGSGSTATGNNPSGNINHVPFGDPFFVPPKDTGAGKVSTAPPVVQGAGDTPNDDADTPGSDVDMPGAGGDVTIDHLATLTQARDFLIGTLAGLAEANGIGPDTDPFSQANDLGLRLGHAVALLQGIIEIDSGATMITLGIAVSSTGAGAVVGVPVATAGAVVTSHGALVTYKSLRLMMEDLSRGVQPARHKGKRMTSGDDALDQLTEVENAQRKFRQGKSKIRIDSIDKSKKNANKQLRDAARDASSGGGGG